MKKRYIYLISFLMFLLPHSGFSRTLSELQKLVHESKARVDIVDVTQKAVVHIQVEKTIRSRTGGQQYNNPFDLFNDQFFGQFFPGLKNQRSFPGQPRQFKVAVQNITPNLAEQYGYSLSTGGVVVTSIFPNSPAARAGLRPGLLILEINRQDISDVNSFETAVSRADVKRGVLMLIGSRQGTQYIMIKDG